MTVIGNRPSSSTPTRLGALALAATMLAACQATPDSIDATAVSSDMPTDGTPTPVRPASPQGALDEFTIRINGGMGGGTVEELQEEFELRRRQTEEYIAACMAEQGFTYYPDLGGTVTATVVAGPLPGTREFAEQFAFGISHDSQDGGVPGTFGIALTGNTWANADVTAAMSAAERTAWFAALYGPWFGTPELVEVEWDERGCSGQAQLAISPDLQLPSEFAAIRDEVNRFADSVQVDPQMTALNAEWTGCLAAAGHPGWLHRQQLMAALWQEWWTFSGQGDQDARLDLLLAWDWDAAPDGPPGWTLGEDGVGVWDEVSPGALAAFREREFDTALADVGCREALDFDTRQREIELRLQQAFVDRNLAELEAWAAWVEARRQFGQSD